MPRPRTPRGAGSAALYRFAQPPLWLSDIVCAMPKARARAEELVPAGGDAVGREAVVNAVAEDLRTSQGGGTYIGHRGQRRIDVKAPKASIPGAPPSECLRPALRRRSVSQREAPALHADVPQPCRRLHVLRPLRAWLDGADHPSRTVRPPHRQPAIAGPTTSRVITTRVDRRPGSDSSSRRAGDCVSPAWSQPPPNSMTQPLFTLDHGSGRFPSRAGSRTRRPRSSLS